MKMVKEVNFEGVWGQVRIKKMLGKAITHEISEIDSIF